MFLLSVIALSLILPAAVTAAPDLGTNATTDAVRMLEIRAPEVARVGQTVKMQVVERYSQRPVPLAHVWAIPADIPTPELTDYQESAAFAASKGYYLGRTDRGGMIYHKFDRPNQYLLLTLKWGYIPGIAKIEIKPAIKTLEIRAPEVVKVQQRVPIQVLEKTVLTVIKPVPNAAVWALKTRDVPVAIEAEEYDSLVKRCGIFLGWTNKRGYVDPPPTFQRAGEYLLVALKRGYFPGIDYIKVISPAITVTNVERVSVEPSRVVPSVLNVETKNVINR
jgi:hypothetical protein